MRTWSRHILQFYGSILPPRSLPPGVEVLFPYQQPAVVQAMRQFYEKYYADSHPRYALIGINPGRFGGGVTGIPFTDPIRLQHDCGIENTLYPKPELSSVFMYQMIGQLGGPAAFYRHFYFTSVSPLGFVSKGKNMNYYDDRALQSAVTPFATACMQQQIKWGLQTNKAFCIGEGANFAFLQKLNQQYGWFDELIPLAHPRFVMQYKRRLLDEYLYRYTSALGEVMPV
jgi:hypothetical protein